MCFCVYMVPFSRTAKEMVMAEPSEIMSATSGLYQLRQTTRHALPERLEQLVPRRFFEGVSGTKRDYRDVMNQFRVVLYERGFSNIPGIEGPPSTQLMRRIYRLFSDRVGLGEQGAANMLLDLVVEAMRRCPVSKTEENIYE